jgi:arsenite methyltransferase
MTLRYGIDAPFWVGTLITVGFVFSLISITGLPQSIGGLIFGLFLLCMGLWMFFYSTVIKIKHRYVILRLAEVQAGEEVLDVGTGRGLLAIAAAKLGCNVTAIDHWSQWDISGNGRESFFKNVEIEKAPLIELIDGDARELPFADERLARFALERKAGDFRYAASIRIHRDTHSFSQPHRNKKSVLHLSVFTNCGGI